MTEPILQAPGQITEEVELVHGIPWGGKVYKTVVLRAEMFGDHAVAFDLLQARGLARLTGEGDQAEIDMPRAEFRHYILLARVIKAVAQDGDELAGPSLRTALFDNGLHLDDGVLVLEADTRLGKRLPSGSDSSAPGGPSKSGSESSAIGEESSES